MTARSIVFANRGLAFDGRTVGQQPLGGVESSLIAVAEALAARGHRVSVYNDCTAPVTYRGVEWVPLRQGLPVRADLYVANRDHELLLGVPLARARALWLHNPGWKAGGWRYRLKLALRPARVIVLGDYHRNTLPSWMQDRAVTIPLALAEPFRTAAGGDRGRSPPRRAVFTSNPARNLDWLLRVWSERIHPHVPDAELHLFSGPEVYQMRPGTGRSGMERVLAQADTLRDRGVVRHRPVGREVLVDKVAGARAMLYRGHEEETFCLALAEAQGLGVPCVVQPIGSAPERVRNGITGIVAEDDETFAQGAVRLLTDDALWHAMHVDSLRLQRARGWNDVAQDFERLMRP
ncbi:glycosyltransferase [Muricoccus radiodurans]|uniref:glycosyltransferase n=1 Tax=Muricoccus radiodurans TaxID=2231721 RepID=UPI003CEBA433